MDEEQLIPVAFCKDCKILTPVVIGPLDDVPNLPEFLKGQDIKVVVCPHCFSLLNNGDEAVEIEWYDVDELEKVGYEIINDEGN